MLALKVKSVAICASCAIDDHEDHKVINLTAIDGIGDSFERKNLNTMMSLIEKSMQMAVDSGKMERVVYMFKVCVCYQCLSVLISSGHCTPL